MYELMCVAGLLLQQACCREEWVTHTSSLSSSLCSHTLAGEQHHRLSLLSTQCYPLLLSSSSSFSSFSSSSSSFSSSSSSVRKPRCTWTRVSCHGGSTSWPLFYSCMLARYNGCHVVAGCTLVSFMEHQMWLSCLTGSNRPVSVSVFGSHRDTGWGAASQ